MTPVTARDAPKTRLRRRALPDFTVNYHFPARPKGDKMTGNMWVYCPYCGMPQSEEYELMNLLRKEVFSLSCRECKKDCVLVLYDDIQSSTPTTKTEEGK